MLHVRRSKPSSGLNGCTPRSHSADDDGSYSLELAVIAPSLLFLIFFAIQAALFFYGRSVALQSAREGVSQLRLAQTQADYDHLLPDVNADVVAFAKGVGSGALVGPASVPAYDDAGARVSVKVTGHSISLIPFASFDISETAHGSIERFVNPP